MVTKICPWDGGVCSNVSCDSLDSMGSVRVCSRHRNRNGFHVSRIQVSPVVSIFNKHGIR
jgi:hypothetical protein